MNILFFRLTGRSGDPGRSKWLVSTLLALLIAATSGTPARADSINVRLTGGMDEKFPNLNRVMEQLEQTLADPSLWGDFWEQEIPLSGKTGLTNYTFAEIAPELRKYLTDGSLELEFRVSEKLRIGIAAAQTVGKNKIILFQYAGRSPDEAKYSDYYLAQTLFHELMHVWQYYHWTFMGRMMDYESFPTATEKQLPENLFSVEEFPDPGGSTPVPGTATLTDSDDIATTVVRRPGTVAAIDLIFVIDLTSSMEDDILEVQEAARRIVDTVSAQFADFRIAIVGYRDWGDSIMFEDYPFSSSRDEITGHIDDLKVSGGGDTPEAVLEALLRAIESSTIGGWRDNVEKQVILMGDAPPHSPIPQGPHEGKTALDVADAAEKVDPAVINTILIAGDSGAFDTEAEKAFAELAELTFGVAVTADRAQEVPQRLVETIEELPTLTDSPAEPEAPAEEEEIPSEPLPAVEDETNDLFGKANRTGATHHIDATILPAGDRDWFAFDVDHHGQLEIIISNAAPDLAVNVRVWTANKDALTGWFAPLAAGGDTEAVVDLPAAGRYFLEVAGGDSRQESSQAYALQTRFSASEDQGELNNAFGRATVMQANDSIAATLLPAGDRDWYAVEVEHHGELRITVADVDEELAVNLRVWTANKDALTGWFAPLAAGGNTEAVVDLPAAGRYVVEIAGEDTKQRSIEPFTIQTSFTASADRSEPNGTFGAAAPLLLGQPVEATILPAGDRDWYAFEVDHHGELLLAITGVSEDLAINARVWTSNKDALTGWFAPLAQGGDTEAVVDLPEPGTYYLEIAGNDSKQRSIDPFVIETSYTAAPDPFEPNGTFGRAAAIDLNGRVVANILPAGDQDWFGIEASHHGELTLIVTEVPEEMEVNLRVWNANKDALTGWFAPLAAGGDTEAVVDLPEPGAYAIELAAGDSRQRDIEAFLLNTSYVAAADRGEPNDTSDVATPVNLDETIPANILPAGDRDWCVFEIEEPGELHVLVVNAAPELTINFRLWDENRALSDWFRPLATGGNVEAVIPIAEPGTYYLEVVDNSSRARSIEPYLLRFSMEPIDPADVVETSEEPEAAAFITETLTISQTERTVIESFDLINVTVAQPADWVRETTGDASYVIAPSTEEAQAEIAQGPRFWIVSPSESELDIVLLLDRTDEATILEDPAVVELNELFGESILVQSEEDGQTLIRRYVAIQAGGGQTYLLVQEAPAPLWEESLPLLDKILSSITITTD